MNRHIDHPRRAGLARWLREHLYRGNIYIKPSWKLLCMRVPKTAGTSILKGALPKQIDGPMWYTHINGRRQKEWLENITDDELREYFIFSFIRNPWDRFISHCAYHQDRPPYVDSPSDVIKNWAEYNRVSHFRRHAVPSHKLTHMGGDRICDFIGRFESLQKDYDVLCEQIGVETEQLPHYRKTYHIDYRDASQDVIDFVHDKYARDIELYGYEF